MKIPDRYYNLSPFGYPMNLRDLEEQGGWPQADVYPLPGFNLTFSFFQAGNGDGVGFYWPIGKENQEPILCDYYHDDNSLIPLASSLEGLIKIKVAEGAYDPDDDDYQTCQEIAGQLGFVLPSAGEDEQLSPNMKLSLDSNSPLALKDVAAHLLKAGELELASAHLEHALQVLPEYTEALFMLGSLYRRQRKLPEAAQKMVEVLTAPFCFGGDREKALHSIKRLRNEDYPELESDPLWSQRHKLTFTAGVKYNDDFNIYEEAIVEYLRQGKGILAVRLRVLIGELMWNETISFRERYQYSMEKHLQMLRSEIDQAGLADRLIVVAKP